jgi:hypothetical protein
MKNIWIGVVIVVVFAIAVGINIAMQPSPDYNYVKRTATGTVVSKFDSLKDYNRTTTLRISDANPPLDAEMENDYYHGTVTTNDRDLYYHSQVGDKYEITVGDNIMTRRGRSTIDSRALLLFSPTR